MSKKRAAKARVAYMKAWYRKNRKTIVKRGASYYRKNRKKIAKYHAAYYRKNRKKALLYRAAYYRKNRKVIAKWGVAYHHKNRKKILKYAAAYRHKNPKKIAKLNAAYRHKNRTKLLKYAAAYHHENRKKAVLYTHTVKSRHRRLLYRHNYQLSPRGIKGAPMSLKAHQKKLSYADGRERPCWYCLGENNKTGAGLDRLDNSVTYTVKNSVPCCYGCNSWRSSTHTVKETRNRFKPMRDAARRPWAAVKL